MSLLLESIRAADGVIDDISPHQQRMMRSRRALWGLHDELDIRQATQNIQEHLGCGIWKIRVLYDRAIQNVESMRYEPRPYKTVALIDGGNIDYSHKWAICPMLDKLTKRAHEAGADTALIVKDGFITDFSHANAAFFDGSMWVTPARPLLFGTRRERLLYAGLVATADITPEEVTKFHLMSPINAMLDLGDVTMSTADIIISRACPKLAKLGIERIC